MADHDVFAGFDGGDRRVPVRVVEEDHRAAAGFLSHNLMILRRQHW